MLEKEAKISSVRVNGCQRDSRGSKLFITFSFRQKDDEVFRTAVVTSNGIDFVQGFSRVLYDDSANAIIRLEGTKGQYDDQGRLFWHDENLRYIFKDGLAVPRNDISGFQNVYGGDYILLKFTNKPAWVVSNFTNALQPIIELPTRLDRPQCASLVGGDLIILGQSKLPREKYGISCLIYRRSPSGYSLFEEIPLPWGGVVYDLSGQTGDALIEGSAQMFAAYYRFNIRTKQRTRLGFAPADYVLFLNEDVIRTFDTAIRNSM